MNTDRISRLRNAIENPELNAKYFYGNATQDLLYILDDYECSVSLREQLDDAQCSVEALNEDIAYLNSEIEILEKRLCNRLEKRLCNRLEKC